MRAVVIDSEKRKVILVPFIGDLFSFMTSRLGGEDVQSSIIQSPVKKEDGEVKPGVAVSCKTEALLEEGQTFFRLKGCHHTFPGTCVFLGIGEDCEPLDVPDLIWFNANRGVLWCPPGTKIKEWTMREERMIHPEHGPMKRVTPIPIFCVAERQ